jgi:hypothetical protein
MPLANLELCICSIPFSLAHARWFWRGLPLVRNLREQPRNKRNPGEARKEPGQRTIGTVLNGCRVSAAARHVCPPVALRNHSLIFVYAKQIIPDSYGAEL